MRITQKFLETKVERLNKMVGFDNPEYSTIGSYVLDYAYGGVSLHKYTNKSGGVSDIFRCGYIPKRELCDLISAYENGLYDAKEIS